MWIQQQLILKVVKYFLPLIGMFYILHLIVADNDVGKVIGKGGRTARAIRSVVRAAAIRAGTHVMVEIAG